MPGALSFLLAVVVAAEAPPPPPAPAASVVQCVAAWARATTPTAPAGAVYLTLRNATDHEQQLTGAQTSVCDQCALHRHLVDAQGRMTMEECAAFAIPAHGELVLRPGERHLMLLGLHHGLARGSHFALTLQCDGHPLQVDVRVVSPAADGPDG